LNNIRLRLESLLAALTLISAVAYSLGWLKSLYYYQTFGVGLDMAGLSVQDYLFESWFVVENVLFFILFWWIILKSRRFWAMCIGVLYALIPLASHYAFSAPDWMMAVILIDYRHTLLKWIPLIVIFIIWLVDRKAKLNLWDLSWPYSQGALILFFIVILAWSVSTAKHFGSFDANRVLRSPEKYLAKIRINPKESLPNWDASRKLHVLRTTEEFVILLDLSKSTIDKKKVINLVMVPKDAVSWVEGTFELQIQHGGQYL
jgi:hypothetical protein